MISEKTVKKIEQIASCCIRCRRCMKECIMLNRFAQNPKMLFSQYLELGPEKMDRRIAYSCNECSQCTLKCPKGLNLKAVFQSLKADYAAENHGIVPVQALLASEDGQEKECAPEYCTAVSAGEPVSRPRTARYLFVPGIFPSEPILDHLQSCLGRNNVALFPGRVLGNVTPEILDLLSENPSQVLITACPSSFCSLSKAVPDRKVLFYWDLMHDLIGIPDEAKGIGKNSDVVFNIHDSCVTRDEPTHHRSIRWVLDEMGYRWEEIEKSGCNTRCCGVGGMVCSSDPELYKRVYTRRKEDFTQDHVISYCGSCRGTFETADMDSLHILDLLFADHAYKAREQHKRGYQSQEEMWQRRLETRDRLNNMK